MNLSTLFLLLLLCFFFFLLFVPHISNECSPIEYVRFWHRSVCEHHGLFVMSHFEHSLKYNSRTIATWSSPSPYSKQCKQVKVVIPRNGCGVDVGVSGSIYNQVKNVCPSFFWSYPCSQTTALLLKMFSFWFRAVFASYNPPAIIFVTFWCVILCTFQVQLQNNGHPTSARSIATKSEVVRPGKWV